MNLQHRFVYLLIIKSVHMKVSACRTLNFNPRTDCWSTYKIFYPPPNFCSDELLQMAEKLFADEKSSDDFSNVSDWSLAKFQKIYSPDITKADIWEYLYGVMHAPDWREKFSTELQKNLPRIPLSPGGLYAFRRIQGGGQSYFSFT